jgi:hypothetical protein
MTPVTYPAGCNGIAKGAKQIMSDRNTPDEFAKRYTAAWCSKDPVSVAAFFAADGSLKVNDAEPAVGTAAITEVARGFMTSFPDLEIRMDALEPRGDRLLYHWTLIGTNSGPGGTGQKVSISGYEDWQLGDDGLIAESLGHFDEGDYEQQLRSR